MQVNRMTKDGRRDGQKVPPVFTFSSYHPCFLIVLILWWEFSEKSCTVSLSDYIVVKAWSWIQLICQLIAMSQRIKCSIAKVMVPSIKQWFCDDCSAVAKLLYRKNWDMTFKKKNRPWYTEFNYTRLNVNTYTEVPTMGFLVTMGSARR